MPREQTDNRVDIDPDFVVAFLLRFVENQLHAEMQVRLFDVVDIFGGAVSGMPHVADDIARLHDAALFE